MPRNVALLSVLASLVTLGLKFGAFWITGSVGLLSDAMETFVNLAASIVAVVALTIAFKPANQKFNYGHDKAEYFAGGLEGGLILVAAASIVYSAAGRLFSPVPLENLGWGIAISLVAGLINLVVARVMLKAARHFDSITLEGDARHLMADVWTSAGVIAGIGIIMLKPEWIILDPIIAILVALNITRSGFSLIKRSMKGLMDVSLPDDELKAVESAIREHAGPGAEYHGLRSRKSGSRRFIDFHLLLPGHKTISQAHKVCCLIERDVERQLVKSQVTIHVEPLEDRASWDGDRIGGLDNHSQGKDRKC
ncbi:cation diffusion facilitator family transporter [Desulfonatronovibrio hydrogenovorans]|uniref:cation diffusion facilitator family transporter n=1 Tax=Desulfonatronovibrio hydrogenovorans TaxID=53245 RepID=UPI0004912468|nr:cation diffusion facilitator family transporter [Desulfonatronovibrio hydrogenovorans]